MELKYTTVFDSDMYSRQIIYFFHNLTETLALAYSRTLLKQNLQTLHSYSLPLGLLIPTSLMTLTLSQDHTFSEL